MTIASDSGHYYLPSGEPFYTVIAKDGSTRAANLRDARKVFAVPGVTTIMQVVAKPALTAYFQRQAILAALTLPRVPTETDDEYCDRILADSKAQGRAAADRGSEVHGAMELAIQGKPHLHADLVDATFRACANAGIVLSDGEAERSFATADYGGKVDWHSISQNIVLDFKTKDAIEDPRKLVYDEHGVQLAAYAHGLHMPVARRVNVFIGMDGNVCVHEHDPEDMPADLEKFMLMKRLWQLTKEYFPNG